MSQNAASIILVKAPVTSNKMLTPGNYLLWLKAPEIASTAIPGQFVMVKCGEGNEMVLRRPFTVHQVEKAAGSESRIALLFSVVGSGTRWMSQKQVGEQLDLVGPLGNGFTIQGNTRRLLLVGGGVGISPLVFLAMEGIRKGLEIKMLYGTGTSKLLYPSELLPQSVKLFVVTEDGSKGKAGLVSDYLAPFVSWADQVCACGPVGMYQAIQAQTQLLQGKSVQVSLETRMGCGIGACFGCTINTKNGLKRVCRDGPIFELNDVDLSGVIV